MQSTAKLGCQDRRREGKAADGKTVADLADAKNADCRQRTFGVAASTSERSRWRITAFVGCLGFFSQARHSSFDCLGC
jgi:hypothetical protein